MKADKIPLAILSEYADFVNIFSLDLVIELLEHTDINNYTIELINGKQSPYSPIYSLELVKLKTLKTYTETNLANGFIKPIKFPVDALILLIRSLMIAFTYILITKI